MAKKQEYRARPKKFRADCIENTPANPREFQEFPETTRAELVALDTIMAVQRERQAMRVSPQDAQTLREVNGYLKTLSLSPLNCQRFVAALSKTFKFDGVFACVNPLSLLAACLNVMPYDEYLKTEHWRRVASEAKAKSGSRCAICNADGVLHAHHRTYERRGFEEPGDVIALCADCHAKFHNKTEEAEVGPETVWS